jgi:hypothetical protein
MAMPAAKPRASQKGGDVLRVARYRGRTKATPAA